jgi:TatA/E family protein of Tat protein translocase
MTNIGSRQGRISYWSPCLLDYLAQNNKEALESILHPLTKEEIAVIPNIGPLEIGIILVIVLLVFGTRRLPEVGSSLGRGIRDFGKGLKGEDQPPAVAKVGSEETTSKPS